MQAIGVDIGGTTVKFARIDENGTILARGEKPTPGGDPDQVAALVAETVPELDGQTLPVGVACAGDVNNDTGVVTADNLAWCGVPLGTLLRNRLGRSVTLEQDTHAAMMAEWAGGSLKGEQHALYLTLGTGVGGGAILGGKPYREIRRSASEFGHMITHAGGEPCPCGENGCYERYASTAALVRSAPGYRSAKEIVAAVRAGNRELLPIWENYIDEICVGLISLMNIFGPEVISIGGGISGAGDFFLNWIRSGLEKHESYRRYFHEIDIRLAVFGNDAGVLGAAAAALRRERGE